MVLARAVICLVADGARAVLCLFAIGMLAEDLEINFIANPLDLRKINIPSLILHGEEDNLVDIKFINHFVEQIPNVKLISYPNVGHMPPMEIPEELANDIQAFIKYN